MGVIIWNGCLQVVDSREAACTVDPAVMAMLFRVIAGYATAMHFFRPGILFRISYLNVG